MGLGLKRAGLKSTEIVAAGPEPSALSRASQMGAVDGTSRNLRKALDGAQLVVLDMPTADTREMLEAIGPVLEPGCVVTDTSLAKVQVIGWAKDYLPSGVGFVSGRPLLSRAVTDIEEADSELFVDTNYCLIPAQAADAEAVRTVVGMVEMLGARPIFMDAQEHDSYSAALLLLPLVMSSALVGTSSASNSWKDMARLAGPEFKALSGLASNDPRETEADLLGSPNEVSHWLEQLIAELRSYQNEIEHGDGSLLERLIGAWEERLRWDSGVLEAEQGADVPTSSQSMAGMVVGGRLVDRYRGISDANKSAPWKYPRRS